MKVLQIHNRPRGGGGATAVFEHAVRLLRERGVETVLLTYDSAGLGAGLRGRLRAFAAGLYSPAARRRAADVIARARPDCAHVHDLQPFLSSTLLACRDAGLPVVMTCHNYRLTCPVFSHVDGRGMPCERCLGGREHWCLLMNCRGNRLESAAFALHNVAARRLRLFSAAVDLYLVPSRFAKAHFIRAGFSAGSIVVLPHPLPVAGTAPVRSPEEHQERRLHIRSGGPRRLTAPRGASPPPHSRHQEKNHGQEISELHQLKVGQRTIWQDIRKPQSSKLGRSGRPVSLVGHR